MACLRLAHRRSASGHYARAPRVPRAAACIAVARLSACLVNNPLPPNASKCNVRTLRIRTVVRAWRSPGAVPLRPYWSYCDVGRCMLHGHRRCALLPPRSVCNTGRYNFGLIATRVVNTRGLHPIRAAESVACGALGCPCRNRRRGATEPPPRNL